MSTEDRDSTPSQVDQASEGQIHIEWVPDNVGDGKGQMFIDGTPVGREIIPERLVPQVGPTVPPEEVEALRRERDELAERYEQVEAYSHILGDPSFRQWVQERAEAGELAPPSAPAATVEDTAGYKLRAAEPEFEQVRDVMRLHAETMAPYEAEILNTNPKVFNAYYDRVKSTLGDRVRDIRPSRSIPPPSYTPPRTPREMETILRSKMVDRARVERPGPSMSSADADDDGQRATAKNYARAKARYMRSFESGTPVSRAQAELDMISAYFGDDEPKSRRNRSGLDGY